MWFDWREERRRSRDSGAEVAVAVERGSPPQVQIGEGRVGGQCATQ